MDSTNHDLTVNLTDTVSVLNDASKYSEPNACRYGYLYGFQQLGTSQLGFGRVKKRKPRSQTTPAIANMPDFYMHTVPRITLEKALLGKRVAVTPTSNPSYIAMLDPDVITIASITQNCDLNDIIDPYTMLPSYLAHIYNLHGVKGILDVLARNAHPQALKTIADVTQIKVSDNLALFSEELAQYAQDVDSPILPSPSARAFFLQHVLPQLNDSWNIHDILNVSQQTQPISLSWNQQDRELSERTGVAQFSVTEGKYGIDIKAHMRPDAVAYPAMVLHHSRGISQVIPLHPPVEAHTRAEKKELAQDLAEAIPTVGNFAKAAITAGFFFTNEKGVYFPTTTGARDVPLKDAVSMTIEAPMWDEFGLAVVAADVLASSAGLSALEQNLIRDAIHADMESGSPVWRYRSYIVSKVHAQVQQSIIAEPVEYAQPLQRGTAHSDTFNRASSQNFSELNGVPQIEFNPKPTQEDLALAEDTILSITQGFTIPAPFNIPSSNTQIHIPRQPIKEGSSDA